MRYDSRSRRVLCLYRIALLLSVAGLAFAQTSVIESPNSTDGVNRFPDSLALSRYDWTGDGNRDVIAGASQEDVPGAATPDAGRVYVFNSEGTAGVVTLTRPSPEALAFFGAGAVDIEDVSGNEGLDFVIGAPGEGTTPNQFGRVWILDGTTGAEISQIDSPTPTDFGSFGQHVAALEVILGNGVTEVAISAPGEGNGQVHLLDPGTRLFLWTTTTETAGARFGHSLATMPDVSGDEVRDLVVGARSETVSGLGQAGRVYIVSGATGAPIGDVPSPNPEALGAFGEVVVGLDDVTGDGVGDFAVGAPFEAVNSVDNAGRVYIFDGASLSIYRTLTSVAAGTAEQGGRFGQSIAVVPDMTGDGVDELIVGEPAKDTGGVVDSGGAYVLDVVSGEMLVVLESPSPESFGAFGLAVLGVSDLASDEDGKGELVVGAPDENSGQGRLYFYTSTEFARVPGTGQLHGRITDAATEGPIGCATVAAISADGAAYLAVANVDGSYSMDDLPPSTYRVVAVAPGYISEVSEAVLVDSASVVLNPALDAAPEGETVVTGTVRDAETGVAIVGARVAAFDGSSGEAIDVVYTCASGRFELQGPTLLGAKQAGPLTLAVSSALHLSAEVSVTPIENETVETDIGLTSKFAFPGGVTGIVTDETGAPVGDAQVVVRILPDTVGFGVQTGVDGAFTVPNLGAGEYVVEISFGGFEVSRSSITLLSDDDTEEVELSLVELGGEGEGEGEGEGCAADGTPGAGGRAGASMLLFTLCASALALLHHRPSRPETPTDSLP